MQSMQNQQVVIQETKWVNFSNLWTKKLILLLNLFVKMRNLKMDSMLLAIPKETLSSEAILKNIIAQQYSIGYLFMDHQLELLVSQNVLSLHLFANFLTNGQLEVLSIQVLFKIISLKQIIIEILIKPIIIINTVIFFLKLTMSVVQMLPLTLILTSQKKSYLSRLQEIL